MHKIFQSWISFLHNLVVFGINISNNNNHNNINITFEFSRIVIHPSLSNSVLEYILRFLNLELIISASALISKGTWKHRRDGNHFASFDLLLRRILLVGTLIKGDIWQIKKTRLLGVIHSCQGNITTISHKKKHPTLVLLNFSGCIHDRRMAHKGFERHDP